MTTANSKPRRSLAKRALLEIHRVLFVKPFFMKFSRFYQNFQNNYKSLLLILEYFSFFPEKLSVFR